ncbi:MAG: hypothetical protein A3K59_01090 [Euryarchaeota archaeon RBG_19FT_COMBO_69_17]|nr:MAG: hypothetical protein A3K59_01090 [Euryarchaeota archaeon RBG_19FT_COMBO_69_17]
MKGRTHGTPSRARIPPRAGSAAPRVMRTANALRVRTIEYAAPPMNAIPPGMFTRGVHMRTPAGRACPPIAAWARTPSSTGARTRRRPKAAANPITYAAKTRKTLRRRRTRPRVPAPRKPARRIAEK